MRPLKQTTSTALLASMHAITTMLLLNAKGFMIGVSLVQ